MENIYKKGGDFFCGTPSANYEVLCSKSTSQTSGFLPGQGEHPACCTAWQASYCREGCKNFPLTYPMLRAKLPNPLCRLATNKTGLEMWSGKCVSTTETPKRIPPPLKKKIALRTAGKKCEEVLPLVVDKANTSSTGV